MNSNLSEILSQLANGKITAEQAAEPLRSPSAAEAAPSDAPQPSTPPAQPEQQSSLANRWLRIRVSDIQSGRKRVSVNVPLSWVPFGLRLGARYSPEVAGLDINELLAMLQSGANGQLVDVEDHDSGEHVQIYVE